MATYKNTNGDYVITVADGAGNLIVNANFSTAGNTVTLTANDSVTINTAETILNSNLDIIGNTVTFAASDSVAINAPQTTLTGNLTVLGNATYINVQDITVGDPFITVAGNNTGSTGTAIFQNQGLVAQTSATTFAGIRFNNANLTWQISPSVGSDGTAIGSYANIATSSGSYLIAAPTNAGTFGAPTWSEQGIIARTASGTYAGLRFNNNNTQWEVSPSVGSDGTAIVSYANVAISNGAYLIASPTNSGPFGAPTWSAQGVIARTSSSTYAGLRFSNDSLAWEISSSVGSDGTAIDAYANVATSLGPYLVAAPKNTGDINTAQWPDQGVITQTSSNTYAGLRFDNNSLAWQISSNVTSTGTAIDPYETIAKISDIIPAAPQFAVQFNVDNVFVGSNNLTFDYNIDQLALVGHQVFGNIVTAPAAVANSVAVYHNAQGSGGTGLYVRASDIEDELVSKSRAIVFGLIL